MHEQDPTNGRFVESYGSKIKDEILQRVAQGEAVSRICRDDGMPSKMQFYRWLKDDPDYYRAYAIAQEYRADFIFDELLDLAKDEAGELTDTVKIMRARYYADTCKWALGRMNGKRYGDKITQEHTVIALTHEEWLKSLDDGTEDAPSPTG